MPVWPLKVQEETLCSSPLSLPRISSASVEVPPAAIFFSLESFLVSKGAANSWNVLIFSFLTEL